VEVIGTATWLLTSPGLADRCRAGRTQPAAEADRVLPAHLPPLTGGHPLLYRHEIDSRNRYHL